LKRVLISVSDKTGIVGLAQDLAARGAEIVSTGGTAKVLASAGIGVTNISDLTGFPECLDGRVKTLHPKVHAGLLAVRSNAAHMEQLKKLGIEPIDMVIINLYPFKQTILKGNIDLEEAIENIDIGGPAMLRAAACNYRDVVALVDPEDYAVVLEEIAASGNVSIKTRFRLACKVFEHTSNYDTLIAKYFRDKLGEEFFPDTLSLTYEKLQEMRYGENPHQRAVFYRETGADVGCLTNAKQLHGKELSYNNINDANGALELIKEFDEPTAVIFKDADPCSAASGSDIRQAYVKAFEADPVSAYGGIVAVNREVDGQTAEEMNKTFYEVILAPSFSAEALSILTDKKNIRLLELENMSARLPEGTYDIRKITGGLLVQEYDNELINMDELKCVTDVKPTDEQMEDLFFAAKVVKHTRSNGIVLAKDKQTTGIGPGQTARVTALKIAVDYGNKDQIAGSVMASDGFFPFSDCVLTAHEAGIKAILQPGGSIRDQESIDACNRFGIAMIFTGMRHFKH
jgi:phosphoribosylaminoimidazolecarboxamide formyltransferase/IMP cyclohydrolase